MFESIGDVQEGGNGSSPSDASNQDDSNEGILEVSFNIPESGGIEEKPSLALTDEEWDHLAKQFYADFSGFPYRISKDLLSLLQARTKKEVRELETVAKLLGKTTPNIYFAYQLFRAEEVKKREGEKAYIQFNPSFSKNITLTVVGTDSQIVLTFITRNHIELNFIESTSAMHSAIAVYECIAGWGKSKIVINPRHKGYEDLISYIYAYQAIRKSLASAGKKETPIISIQLSNGATPIIDEEKIEQAKSDITKGNLALAKLSEKHATGPVFKKQKFSP